MLEQLQHIDEVALLAINGWHNDYSDIFWWLTSSKLSWTLLIVALVIALISKPWRQALLVVAMIALAVTLADQISSSIIKDVVERLRPTHNPSLAGYVHVVNDYRGGMYGFVSSHAANSFACAMLLTLIVRHHIVTWSLFAFAVLQCYSRVYLGVHYPGDILGGLLVGLLVGWVVWLLWQWLCQRWHFDTQLFNRRDAQLVAGATILTLLLLIGLSFALPQ